MCTALKTLPDKQFQKQFEDHSLNPKHFNHIGHLRIAWIYLRQSDLELASKRTCSGIQSYATSLGASDKFHATITESILKIMAKRISKSRFTDFPSFLAQNPDLVKDALSVLYQFYSEKRLFSAQAKKEFVRPDIKNM